MKKTGSPVSVAAASSEPAQAARAMGLRYVMDDVPGIRRLAGRAGFRYVGADDKPLRDRQHIVRIKSLVIPPAWTEVWICPFDNGHIQVTARDARGRKQYRYHKRWREVRDETKYGRMVAFGKLLPQIRARVEADLARPGMPREKVLAALVRLLETTRMRVGNEEYARNNRSFGLTTLRDKHVQISGSRMQFKFRGKSGKEHDIRFDDRRLTRIVQRCRDIPGQLLFQYIDEDGQRHPVGSADVNDYLRDIAGDDYTAKDFRTWAGTVLAALALQQMAPFQSAAEAKKNVVLAIAAVAEKLGNTASICRKCYVHPVVLEAYLGGGLELKARRKNRKTAANDNGALSTEEAAVLAFLELREAAAVT